MPMSAGYRGQVPKDPAAPGHLVAIDTERGK